MIFPPIFHDFPTFVLRFSHIFPTIFRGMMLHLRAQFQASNLPGDADWQAVALDKGLRLRHRLWRKKMVIFDHPK